MFGVFAGAAVEIRARKRDETVVATGAQAGEDLQDGPTSGKVFIKGTRRETEFLQVAMRTDSGKAHQRCQQPGSRRREVGFSQGVLDFLSQA